MNGGGLHTVQLLAVGDHRTLRRHCIVAGSYMRSPRVVFGPGLEGGRRGGRLKKPAPVPKKMMRVSRDAATSRRWDRFPHGVGAPTAIRCSGGRAALRARP